MTREEQIKYKAGTIADGCIAHGAPWKEYYQGFIEGARWADANPYKPSIPSDIDEAAENYYENECPYDGEARVVNREHDVWFPSQAIEDAFKAGVEWMVNQNKN